MSLLMQALKKAERAKQSHLPAGDMVSPSEELDPVLPSAPGDDTRAPAPSVRGADLSLQELSLSPLPEDPPVLSERHPTLSPEPLLAATPAPAAAPARPERRSEPRYEAPRVAPARAEAQRQPRTAPPPKGSSAAPVRGARDPGRQRLYLLAVVALLIVLYFAYSYWKALYGPGDGARLPMVPMPAPSAAAALPADSGQLVVAPPSGAGLAPTPDQRPPSQQLAEAQVAQNVAPAQTDGLPPAQLRNLANLSAGQDAAAAPHPYPGTAGQGGDAHDGPQPQQTMPAPAQQAAQPQAQQPIQPTAPQPAMQAAAPVAQSAAPRRRPAVAADSGAAGTDNGAGIEVRRSNATPRINPSLQAAYQSYTNGDMASARQQYSAVLQQDPNNRDALLGTAAVALAQRQPGAATGVYLRLLELDPNDGDAVAGLAGMRQGDPAQTESRLKAIVQRSPEAGPALFALGNLYAQQSRWADAEQAYFRAYSAVPDNPDYAYNLAVGLDRLNQGKLAIGYYQRALALATNTPGNFNRIMLRRRLHELGQALTPSAPQTQPGMPGVGP